MLSRRELFVALFGAAAAPAVASTELKPVKCLRGLTSADIGPPKLKCVIPCLVIDQQAYVHEDDSCEIAYLCKPAELVDGRWRPVAGIAHIMANNLARKVVPNGAVVHVFEHGKRNVFHFEWLWDEDRQTAVEDELAADFQHGFLTPNEVRSLRGRPHWVAESEDPLVR